MVVVTTTRNRMSYAARAVIAGGDLDSTTQLLITHTAEAKRVRECARGTLQLQKYIFPEFFL